MLAVIAGRMDGVEMQVYHAVSPAVPARATQRVRDYAQTENWDLTIADAGEFRDQRYIQNPLDRCYYCKSNLYSHIAEQTTKTILSGTNLDDLSDFRPGLNAAQEHAVRHPYVEAKIRKSDIRRLADCLQLSDLTALPASPCLSSRVETGVSINPLWLQAIDQVEVEVQRLLDARVVRCRIRNQAIVIELDESTLERLTESDRARLSSFIEHNLPVPINHYPLSFAPYCMGSSFVAE